MTTLKVISCDCDPFRPVNASFDHSDIVIHGKIIKASLRIEIERSKNYIDSLQKQKDKYWYTDRLVNEYQVVVIRGYKGVNTKDTIIIRTGEGGGDCGLIYKVNDRIIFYATKIKNGDMDYSNSKLKLFWTSECTRTDFFDKKEEEEILSLIGSR